MPVWKLQTAFGGDSALPRDKAIITPHFNDEGATTDPQQLCEDWAAAVDAATIDNREITVKAYDAQGSAPVYPQGEFTILPTLNPPAQYPREIALCLSFYSGRNVGRRRGRLYFPWFVIGNNPPAGRPSELNMELLRPFANAAQQLGGVDVDWCVYSRLDNVARPVTNWWVDNEWDTIRSRGLRGSSRIYGTTSEG